MQLVNSGITVVTLKDNQVYNKATINNDISRLMLSLVIMMRAHDESAMKAHRLREAWKNKRNKIGTEKLSAQCPRWLKLSADRKSFIEIPEHVKIVRRIFQMSLDGIGIDPIARTFNEEGVPTLGRSKGWQFSYIERILRSRAVIGEYQPKYMQGGI